MKQRKYVSMSVVWLLVFCMFASLFVGSAYAYLTYLHDTLENNFTIALDATSTVIEKYPTYDDVTEDPVIIPVLNGLVTQYEKLVQVGNTGYLDEYVRLRFDFSEKDIENKTSFSWDGKNYYSVADYKNHLPNGWVYNEKDGFYYYKPIVYAGNWEEISKNLNYAEELGEYFYKKSDQTIISDDIVTVPLVRYMKTTFTEPVDIRSYAINVYSECVPFYFGSDYASAWENYTAN